MNRKMVPAVLLLLGFFSSGAVLAGGDANFVLGARGLDEDFWAPDENQGVLGVTVDFGRKDWPVHLAAGAFVSGAEETTRLSGFGFSGTGKFTASVGEISFGVMKIWLPSDNVHPYIGGGAALVSAHAELEISGVSVDDDDGSLGAYAQGGVFWRLGRKFNIGVDGRLVAGTDIDLFGVSGDADYAQLGIVLGWGWD